MRQGWIICLGALLLVAANASPGTGPASSSGLAIGPVPLALSMLRLAETSQDALPRIEARDHARGRQLAALPGVAPAMVLNVDGSVNLRPLATAHAAPRTTR